MGGKQARLKKITTIIFLVVSCITVVLYLYKTVVLLFYSSILPPFIRATESIGLIIVIVLSTLLFLQHIKFKRSIPLGIINLIALIVIFAVNCLRLILFGGITIDVLLFNIISLIFTVVYAAISSIHFFSNKVMRKSFLICVLIFVAFMFGTVGINLRWIVDIILSLLFVMYGVSEFFAFKYSSGWYCEKCGNKNGDKNLFCTKCGVQNPFLNK